MVWPRYTLEMIPHWCQMSLGSHFDGVGGCWGIYHGSVTEKGEEHCITCEYHFKQVAGNKPAPWTALQKVCKGVRD